MKMKIKTRRYNKKRVSIKDILADFNSEEPFYDLDYNKNLKNLKLTNSY